MPSPLTTHRRQIETILAAWGMPPDKAATTAEIMADADLRAIDSHGMSMIPTYERWWKEGRLKLDAEPRILRETPVAALVDAQGGLGHVPSAFAMEVAIRKAGEAGIGAVAVRNSAHHGALQWYVRMAAARGLIGIATTTTSNRCSPPTYGRQAKLGTDPWAFAAPTGDDAPFVLDMATTTVAQGRVRNRQNEGLQCPPGWVLDRDGNPSTDPGDGVPGGTGFMAHLGGTPEGAAHKGYGLGAMVNILAAGLSGALISPHPARDRRPGSMDIGHFFMAIAPDPFRDRSDFAAAVRAFCDDLRATPAVDPAKPVRTPGEPERIAAERRSREGIPVGPGLAAQVRAVAARAGVPFILS